MSLPFTAMHPHWLCFQKYLPFDAMPSQAAQLKSQRKKSPSFPRKQPTINFSRFLSLTMKWRQKDDWFLPLLVQLWRLKLFCSDLKLWVGFFISIKPCAISDRNFKVLWYFFLNLLSFGNSTTYISLGPLCKNLEITNQVAKAVRLILCIRSGFFVHL